MEVQPQLVLLQKTLLNIEGLGRQLYPELDLWITAKPFLERWMSEQIGRRAFLKKLKTNLPAITEHLPDLPIKLNKIIEEASAGRLEIEWKSEELVRLRREIRSNQRNTASIISGGSLLLSGTLILVFGSSALLPAAMTSLLGGGLGVCGGLVMLRGWWNSERNL
jgi:ubiquinone biosynthesis protein